MKAVLKMIFIVVLGASMGCVSAPVVTSKDIQKITKERLRSILGDPNVIIMDVRPEQQWKASDLKLPGAVYENPKKVESWAEKYQKDQTLILY